MTLLTHGQIRWLDLAFDVYRKSSTKKGAREKRGTASPLKVRDKTPLPKNWKNVLRVDGNKSELFKMLAKSVVNSR